VTVSSAMAPKKKAGKSAQPPEEPGTKRGERPYRGFGQYAGEGPVFFIRQFSGFVLATIGVLIMASGYSEDYRVVPLSPTNTMYLSLAVMLVGLVLHELRPWKVRTVE
jgi:hypothetical protein